jgi:hypothetical protein
MTRSEQRLRRQRATASVELRLLQLLSAAKHRMEMSFMWDKIKRGKWLIIAIAAITGSVWYWYFYVGHVPMEVWNNFIELVSSPWFGVMCVFVVLLTAQSEKISELKKTIENESSATHFYTHSQFQSLTEKIESMDSEINDRLTSIEKSIDAMTSSGSYRYPQGK